MIERLCRLSPQQFRASDMELVAAGISHKTAPLALREQLAVAQADVADERSPDEIVPAFDLQSC